MNLTKDFLNWICLEFDIGEIEHAIPLKGLSGAGKWELRTKNGKYVLTKLKRLDDLKDTLFMHEALEKLANSEFRYLVPTPIQSKDKRTVIDAENGLYWICPFIEGKVNMKPTKTRIIAVAQMLASLHKIGSKIKIIAKKETNGYLDGYQQTELIQKVVSKEKELGLNDTVAKHVRRKAEKLLPLITNADEKWHLLSKTLIHGDCHMSNMVFEGDKLVGVLDFWLSSYGNRIADVALLIFYECREGGSKHKIDYDKATACIRAYHERNELTEEEIEYLPSLLINIAIVTYWFEYRLIRAGEEHMTVHKMMRSYKSAHWFYEHKEEIINWIKEILNV